MNSPSVANLLAAARGSSAEPLGKLLGMYVNYLKLVAAAQIDQRLRRRFSESDVVQETLMAAHHGFAQFRGSTEAEFLGWLRRILVNELARMIEKHVGARRRDARREISLDQLAVNTDRSALGLDRILASDSSTPSKQAENHERLIELTNAIASLPADYREVLVLRHLRNLSFPEVAEKLGRTPGATRMLWMRAIEQLRQCMEASE